MTDKLTNNYGFHPATTDEAKNAHKAVRDACLALAHYLEGIVPAGREAALVQTKLEEAMFWANAGIARTLSPLEK